MHLYIDTAHQQYIGLLDEGYNWIEYKELNLKKASSAFHHEVLKLLENNNYDFKDIMELYYCSGPGSYTGMRLSHTLASFMELEGTPVYSFYSFELPKLVGHSAGTFYSNAFKGETFVYKWDHEEASKALVPSDKFKIEENNEAFNLDSVSNLIFKNSQKVFPTLKKLQIHLPLYYYRDLDQEFQKKAND